jgi:hypothetical protein
MEITHTSICDSELNMWLRTQYVTPNSIWLRTQYVTPNSSRRFTKSCCLGCVTVWPRSILSTVSLALHSLMLRNIIFLVLRISFFQIFNTQFRHSLIFLWKFLSSCCSAVEHSSPPTCDVVLLSNKKFSAFRRTAVRLYKYNSAYNNLFTNFWTLQKKKKKKKQQR